MVSLVRATQKLIDGMKGRLKPEDEAEVQAMLGVSADDGLQQSFELSDYTQVAVVDGRPELAFGVGSATISSLVGRPWMLSTEELFKHQIQAVRWTKAIILDMLLDYPYLENWTYAESRKSIRWLRWAGFEFDKEPQTFGCQGKLFYRFWRERDPVLSKELEQCA